MKGHVMKASQVYKQREGEGEATHEEKVSKKW